MSRDVGEPVDIGTGDAAVVSLVRYDIRPDAGGWTIYDRQTNEPAAVEGHPTVGLLRADAEEIADLLNTLSFIERHRRVH
jgi:hypothetical protein